MAPFIVKFWLLSKHLNSLGALSGEWVARRRSRPRSGRFLELRLRAFKFLQPQTHTTATIATAARRSSTMASSSSHRVEALSKPESLNEVLAQDNIEDCMPCRITGSKELLSFGHQQLANKYLRRCCVYGTWCLQLFLWTCPA